MKRIYIFSGLGTDKRVFQKMDFTAYNTIFIDWISPNKNESIESYAKRLTEQIKDEKPTIIGLSFGGIIAIEVAKIIQTEKIILIASAKTKNEIPNYFRIAGKLNLHKLVPEKLIKLPNFISYWFFGTENKKDKVLLAEILKDTDEIFLKWAIDKIVNWKNEFEHKNVIHIHGTTDRILPFKYINCNIKVIKGGHFMTLNKAKELNQIIKKNTA